MLNQFIVILEFITLVILMFSMALIADKFLIPTLTNIAKKYLLSEQVEGILLAIGSSIPEFTTNLIASISNNVDIGIGAMAGSGSYDFTLCFSFASLFTSGMALHAILYYRDSVVYLITLGLLTFFLFDQRIKLYEAAILTCLWPVYIIIATFKVKDDQSNNQLQEINNNEVIDILNSNNQPIEETSNKNQSEIAVFDINNIKEKTELNEKSKSNAAPNYIDINSEKYNDDEIRDYDSKIKDDEQSILLQSAIETNKNQNEIEMNNQPRNIGYYFNQFYEKSGFIYSYFVPLWINSPICGFLIIMLFIFFHSNLLVFIIRNISDRLNLSETFLGMTIISWGGNIGDTINACVAAKINAKALISTSILGSQITNLQLCLGLPWLICIIKRKIQGLETSDIVFGSLNLQKQNNPLYYFIPLLACVLFSMMIFSAFRMNLNKWSGGLLALVYVLYFTYELYIQTY